MKNRLISIMFLLIRMAILIPSNLHAGIVSRASSSLGFAIEKQNPRDDNPMSGSFVFFDVTYAKFSRLTIGLRSIGAGGDRPDQQYYRLSSGMLAGFDLNNTLGQFQGFVGFFKGSFFDIDLQATNTKGGQALISWIKPLTTHFNDHLKVNWGSFFSIQQGVFGISGKRFRSFSSGVFFNLGFDL